MSISSFRYTSDDDNSSVTSGSGFGAGVAHNSPQNVPQPLSANQQMAAEMGPLREDVLLVKESNRRMEDSIGLLLDKLESFKVSIKYYSYSHSFSLSLFLSLFCLSFLLPLSLFLTLFLSPCLFLSLSLLPSPSLSPLHYISFSLNSSVFPVYMPMVGQDE